MVWAWLPLLLTAVVRVAWLTRFPVDPIAPIDPEGFHLLAVNLLSGHGFAIGWDPPFCPTAVRTPLYPLVLAGTYALLGRDPDRAVLLQVLLEVLTTSVVIALVRELLPGGKRASRAPSSGGCAAFGPKPPVHPGATRRSDRAVVMAGLLYAVNGTTLRFTGYLFSETFLLPVLTLALLVTLRTLRRPTTMRTALSGVAWGLVLLTKPNVQYLALMVGVLVSLRSLGLVSRFGFGGRGNRRRWRPVRARTPDEADAAEAGMIRWRRRGRAAGFWLALGLILTPWLVRNRLALGRWVLSTAFEENVARVSAVATEAALRGVVAEPWTETWEAIYDDLEARAVPELPRSGAAQAAVPCEVRVAWQRRIARVARGVVLTHPGTYLVVHLRGVLRGGLDPGHRVWYRVLTGRDWATTGVVPDIVQRMAWSLERGAVGDALTAFWTQRVSRVPPTAGLVWWGLVVGRVAMWFLTLRGLWALRHRPSALLVLAAVLAYHIVLPGPIAHDRFYVPIVPVVVALVATGLSSVARFGRTRAHWCVDIAMVWV